MYYFGNEYDIQSQHRSEIIVSERVSKFEWSLQTELTKNNKNILELTEEHWALQYNQR